MKKAGVKHIQYGIESGCQDVLDFYNKKTTPNQIRKAVNLAAEMDFLTIATFIFGAPLETEKHIEQTIKFACSLPLDIAIFSPLFYQHGSDLWTEAVISGKISDDDGYFVCADSRKDLGNFTSQQLRDYCEKAFRRFYFRPKYITKELVKSLKRKDSSLLKIGLDFF